MKEKDDFVEYTTEKPEDYKEGDNSYDYDDCSEKGDTSCNDAVDESEVSTDEATDDETNAPLEEPAEDDESQSEDTKDILEDESVNVNRLDKFSRLMMWVTSILMLCYIYINSTVYLPKSRELSFDNIYDGSKIIISQEEQEQLIDSLEDIIGLKIDYCDYDDYCLLNAILENDNLSSDDKSLFCKAFNLIKENPYLNKEKAYHSLLNVDVVRKKRPITIEKNVEGVYISKYESIGIFEDDPDNRILFHELVHCIFENDITATLPEYFKEGMTELLTNEYFAEDPYLEVINYPFEISVVKMLCEVSSPDAVLKAYSEGDMSIVAKEIAKITNDLDGANRALDSVDLYMKQYNGQVPEEEKVDNNILINNFIPLFRKVMDIKYPKPHDDDSYFGSTVSYYYNEALFSNTLSKVPYDSYIDTLLKLGVDSKPYFSSKLMAASKGQDQFKKVIQN